MAIHINVIYVFLILTNIRVMMNTFYGWNILYEVNRGCDTYLLVILVVVRQHLIGSQVLTRCPPL